MDVDLVTVAAFTAAGLSLVNVWISGRLTRRGQLEQWRRDAERPIVARIVALSQQSLEALGEAAQGKAQWIDSLSRGDSDTGARDRSVRAWQADEALYEELRFQFAQLDLTADRPLREAARVFLSKHESLRHVIRPAGGAEEPERLFIQMNNEMVELRHDLLDRARVDLGVDRQRLRLSPRPNGWRVQR